MDANLVVNDDIKAFYKMHFGVSHDIICWDLYAETLDYKEMSLHNEIDDMVQEDPKNAKLPVHRGFFSRILWLENR